MTEHFAGTYFDGIGGRAHEVELRRVGNAHFVIEGEGVQRSGAIRDLTPSPRLARIARTIELKDGGRVLLAHDADIDAWLPPREGRMEALVDRLERHAYAVAAAMFVCAATLAIGAKWGVPWLADRIAEKIPPSVERSLGEHVLENLDRLGLEASGLEAERRNELAARFDKLVAASGQSGERLEFRDAPGIGANAFALPGGTVVVTDQLVDILHDDREFDAVVAHEIGHQQHRHALRQTLRSSFVAIVAALFAGDVSSAGTVVVAIPTFLLDSHYSRGFEEEADRYAFDLLARIDESPRWFAAAMRRLSAETPEEGQLAYLSSHPTSEERIDAADAAGQRFAVAHPELCPDQVCPGEEESDDEDDCEDCDEDAGTADDEESRSLACGKDHEF